MGGLNGAEMGLGLGLGMVGRETDRDRDVGGADLLCTLSEVRRSQESLLDSPHNPNSAPGQAPPPSSISQFVFSSRHALSLSLSLSL